MISRRNVRDKRNVGPPSRDRTDDLSCIPYFLVGFKEREDGEKRRKKKRERKRKQERKATAMTIDLDVLRTHH